MISITFCISFLTIMAIGAFSHLLAGPRSEHPVSGVLAYALGVVPVIIAFALVVLVDEPSPWRAIADLVLLFAAEAIFPIFGRLWSYFIEFQDMRYLRQEDRRGKKHSL